MKATLTFLGTGTSGGVPEIGCDCEVCRSTDPKNNRLRTSAWLHNKDISVLFDCSSDFRQQALKFGIKHLDAVFVTHTHHDHISGVDDLRSFCNYNEKIKVYIRQSEAENFRRTYHYMFEPLTQIGGGIPNIDLLEIYNNERFMIKNVIFEPLEVFHGILPILGYKFGNVVYITDAKSLPESTIEKASKIKYLIINTLRYKAHETHLNIEEMLEVVKKIKPHQTFLIHTTHQMDYEKVAGELPDKIRMAYDGMELEIEV
ncbi:MAG: MBL fold metallo-hydrolase [Candidatus Margulisbacteria bacterium]|nr:MBL fold metallo-hydrolase [Candidatus Margulisiibacteriota bacterium]